MIAELLGLLIVLLAVEIVFRVHDKHAEARYNTLDNWIRMFVGPRNEFHTKEEKEHDSNVGQ